MMADNTLTLIGFIVTLIGVFVSAYTTSNKVTNTLDKQNALQQQEIEHIKNDIAEMKEDIKSHNHYAKLFAETMPVVQERQAVANHRIDDLERKVN